MQKMSYFPNGFRTGVAIRGLPLLQTYGGNIFWVDSGAGSDSGNGTYHRPFATIDYAIGRCTASNGDIIVCKAGHAETLTSASAITFDVAGVTCVAAAGATGALRPKLTFSSIDNSASVVVSADDVSIIGLLGIGGDDGLTAAFVVTGDNSYIDIEWQDASATVEAACAVQFNTANNVRCILKYNGFTAGNACLNAIQLIDCDNVEIDIDAYGEFSTGIVEMLTTASTNVLVRGYFYNDNVALTKNVVNTGGLACTWYASGYDGKGGYSFSGGSASALAADDVSTAATYASTASSQAASVGLQTSTVQSKTDSVGIQASTVQSKADSVGLTTSTVSSKTDSVGLTASTVSSKADSVGITASTVSSKADSIGIQASTVSSKSDSVGLTASTTSSQAASVGIQASTLNSKTDSVALIISLIASKTGAV